MSCISDLAAQNTYAPSPIVLVTVLVMPMVTNLSYRISFRTSDREQTPISLPSFFSTTGSIITPFLSIISIISFTSVSSLTESGSGDIMSLAIIVVKSLPLLIARRISIVVTTPSNLPSSLLITGMPFIALKTILVATSIALTISVAAMISTDIKSKAFMTSSSNTCLQQCIRR